MHLSFL